MKVFTLAVLNIHEGLSLKICSPAQEVIFLTKPEKNWRTDWLVSWMQVLLKGNNRLSNSLPEMDSDAEGHRSCRYTFVYYLQLMLFIFEPVHINDLLSTKSVIRIWSNKINHSMSLSKHCLQCIQYLDFLFMKFASLFVCSVTEIITVHDNYLPSFSLKRRYLAILSQQI